MGLPLGLIRTRLGKPCIFNNRGPAGVIPNVNDLIQADAYRYTGQVGGKAIRSAYKAFPGFRFTYHLRRVAHLAPRRKSLALLPYIVHRLFLNHYRFRYGFDISPTTSIGPGFYLGHFGGVVISPFAVLGANINIAQGVTIGAASRGARKGAPTLADRVWVGAHGIVVGNIHVAEDALLAPGAYVNFDVPAEGLVLGNPGKLVSMTGSRGYVNNTWPPEHAQAEPTDVQD